MAKSLKSIVIDIGIKIQLAKFLETRMLVESDSGSGKSWTLRKMAEEISGKVQQIIIDPEGDFVTLREKYPFALVSKTGGDIPLSIRHAETLAHKILETGISVIIDLYEFKQPEREEFVRVFCEALINAPKALWHPCIIYLDEAQMFCPEDKRAVSTNSVIDVCTRGRKRGLAAVLATQRISILNKSAAAQCKNKLMGSTSLPLDQKRVGAELGLHNKDEIRNLRNLNAGEFYGFGPAISKEIVMFKVSDVKTTHVKSGSKLTAVPPTPAAIKKILSKLEDIPEEAERALNSKKEYQAEIKRLNGEITQYKKAAKGGAIVSAGAKHIETIGKIKYDENSSRVIIELQKEKVKFQNLYDSEVAYSEALRKELDGTVEAAKQLATTLAPALLKFKIKLPERKKIKFNAKVDRIDNTINRPVSSAKHVPSIKKTEKPVRESVGDDKMFDSSLPPGEKAILIALVQFDHALERDQLTTLTGYRRSSRNSYISRLKDKGLIDNEGDKLIATEKGIQFLGDDFEKLPTGEDLQRYWLEKLPPGEKAILRVLIDAYPDAVDREEISALTKYERSSRNSYISRMAAKELIEVPNKGEVRASENLFD